MMCTKTVPGLKRGKLKSREVQPHTVIRLLQRHTDGVMSDIQTGKAGSVGTEVLPCNQKTYSYQVLRR
ncbi:hypothetical protein GGR92_001465 [Spirosoma lacussanchae]